MKGICWVLVLMAPVAHGLDANGRDCSKPSVEACNDVAPPSGGSAPAQETSGGRDAWLDQALPWQARFASCIRAGQSATDCQALVGTP